jgi:hypothetical protein
MAQPHYAIMYMGSIDVEKGKSYNSTDILTDYPNATVMKIKTDNIKVSINGTSMFLTSFDDESYIPTTNTTYIFSDNCIIAIGKYMTIT